MVVNVCFGRSLVSQSRSHAVIVVIVQSQTEDPVWLNSRIAGVAHVVWKDMTQLGSEHVQRLRTVGETY